MFLDLFFFGLGLGLISGLQFDLKFLLTLHSFSFGLNGYLNYLFCMFIGFLLSLFSLKLDCRNTNVSNFNGRFNFAL